MNRYDYLNKMREPSTWAGVGVLLGLFGINFAPAEAQIFVQGGTGLAGMLAIFLGEKAK